jgi:putative ABC transport system substrate-binding protein
MNRRDLLTLFGAALGASPLAARAQQPGIPRVGVLLGAIPSGEAAKLGVFRDALKQLGYVEGQTIVIEPNYAEGHSDRLPVLA